MHKTQTDCQSPCVPSMYSDVLHFRQAYRHISSLKHTLFLLCGEEKAFMTLVQKDSIFTSTSESQKKKKNCKSKDAYFSVLMSNRYLGKDKNCLLQRIKRNEVQVFRDVKEAEDHVIKIFTQYQNTQDRSNIGSLTESLQHIEPDPCLHAPGEAYPTKTKLSVNFVLFLIKPCYNNAPYHGETNTHNGRNDHATSIFDSKIKKTLIWLIFASKSSQTWWGFLSITSFLELPCLLFKCCLGYLARKHLSI